MRKIVMGLFVSADGVAENADQFPTDWDDDVMDAKMGADLEQQDAVILGRRSYDEWVAFWPTANIEPYTSFINRVDKFVATSTPLQTEWTNTQLIEGDLLEFVRNLREQPGGDIAVHASISVGQALLAADLIDELRLVIVPAIAGTGRRLLDGLPTRRLETLGSSVTPTGKILVDYRVVHDS